MDVKLPQLAEGVEGGTVVSILVSEGQEIKKDQAFMELETQKAVGSIPAPSAGVVTKIHVKQGMEVSVGQVLISHREPRRGCSLRPKPSRSDAAPEQQSGTPTRVLAARQPRRERRRTIIATNRRAARRPRLRRRSAKSPASSASISRAVSGSEAGGRINLADVRAYIQRLQELAGQAQRPGAAAQPAAAPAAAAPRSNRLQQVGPGAAREDVAAPAHREPAHGGVLDDDSQDQSICRRRYHRAAGAAQKTRGQPTKKKARI